MVKVDVLSKFTFESAPVIATAFACPVSLNVIAPDTVPFCGADIVDVGEVGVSEV